MKAMIKAAVMAAAMLGALAAPDPAGALTLKRMVSVSDDVVTVADFFSDAGRHGQAPLFRAPQAGDSGIVSAARLREAVYRLGMSWLPPAGVSQITVTRLAAAADRHVPIGEIENAIAGALADSLADGPGAPGGITVTLGAGSPAMVLAGAEAHALTVAGIDLDTEREAFNATVEVAQGQASASYDVAGKFERYFDVPMLAAPLDRGDIVTPGQITTARMRDPGAGVLVEEAAVVGLAARRNLRAGVALRASDLEAPKLVNRNQLVTIVFTMPGMVLTTQGRALGDGALGEAVPVLNVRSNRIVQTSVEAPGRVSVGSGATRVAMQ